jgi:hypothetical protein
MAYLLILHLRSRLIPYLNTLPLCLALRDEGKGSQRGEKKGLKIDRVLRVIRNYVNYVR